MKNKCSCPNRESDPMIVDPTCSVHIPKDQWKEVDEALDTLIDDDYWSYPEDTRSMIFTTKKIKDLFHSELEKVRQEAEDNMRKRCLEIIKGHSIDKKEITKLYKQGYGASSAECEERNDFIDELVDEIDALDQATQNINNLDKEDERHTK